MNRRDIIFKCLAYGLVVLVLGLLHAYVLPLLPLPLPLLMPLCTVAAGCLEGSRFGAGLGAVSGAVAATLSHGSWGMVALLAVVGWVCGLVGQYVLRQDLWGHILCCVILLAVWEPAQILSLIGRTQTSLGALLPVAGGEALCTLAWAFPVYGLHWFCCRHYGRIYHE